MYHVFFLFDLAIRYIARIPNSKMINQSHLNPSENLKHETKIYLNNI